MAHQKRLFLIVFLWASLCLFFLKSSLSSSHLDEVAAPQVDRHRESQLHARSAASSLAPFVSAGAEYGDPNSVDKSSQHASSSRAPEAPQPAPHEQPQAASRLPTVASQCKYDYPNLFDLQFNNVHWQKMIITADKQQVANNQTASDASYYLYNAYYDDRWRGGLPTIRVLAMIDRVQPPATNCLLWSSKLKDLASGKLVPLITRASFVYAWYPKWGNYKDGLLQPWIITCPMPRAHVGLVPDSVSLVACPRELSADEMTSRRKRDAKETLNMPPSFSSSSSLSTARSTSVTDSVTRPLLQVQYDCKQTLPITNNLPVYNQRPAKKERFAVCVKGLDFPHEDVSVRLVEWIELLNLLGAGKIFFYSLDVHENISKVLHYYQTRGMVELSPLTLPGDQPNLPEYQHLYLKSKLTAKRQNELIPYNDCLYRNLNSYDYLALLDIDEIIMPLEHHNWFDLMQEVERQSLLEQNYSRASYNVRNVYFFDDLAGPLGTTSSSSPSSSSTPYPSQAAAQDPYDQDQDLIDERGLMKEGGDTDNEIDSLERGIPHYLHMMQHVYRSKNYTKPGQYVKCFHNTERVVSLHNHFPMNCFGQCTTYSIPVQLAHLQHYRKDCVGPLKQSCKSDFRVFTQRDTTIWKYKQQMIRRTTRVLNHLGLLGKLATSRT